MKSKKETIDSLQIKLKDFIRSTVRAQDFDVVIPILRKGLFLLERLFPTNRGFKIYLLDPLEDKLPGSIILKNKKILLLDDSARTGRTISEAKQSIISNNFAAKENIHVGVFMKHQECKAEIDYWIVDFDDASGDELYGQLSGYFDSLCHQLDPDHLSIFGTISSKSQTADKTHFLMCIRKELEQLGSYYPQDESICHLWDRTKFAIADLYPSSYGLDGFKVFWKEEGVFKVRFCLEPNWTMYTVPIFCPEIVPPRSRDNKDCDALIEFKFCRWSGSHDEILCRDCIYFNLTEAFAQKFIPTLKSNLMTKGYFYKISETTWSEIQLKYEMFQEKIFASLENLKRRIS